MFDLQTYVARRQRLRSDVSSGIILLPGNEDSPMNFADNPYPFRQDSSFLYFFGLDDPGLIGLIDIDEGHQVVFGGDVTMDQVIWMGPKPSLKEKCESVGILESRSTEKLASVLNAALDNGRPVHFLPQYRTRNVLRLQHLLNIEPDAVVRNASVELIKAVVAQRSVKSAQEVEQIQQAVDITARMHLTAMQQTMPGVYERQVVAAMEAVARSEDVLLSFPTIFSVDGQTLHNHYHGNMMQDGDIAVNDSGAESVLHYAGDITRTMPVGGKFSTMQREVYDIVLGSLRQATRAVRPGVEFRDVHRLASEVLASGLQSIGLMKGDPRQAVEAGAHTLFFQCGVGHMLGLDVHDMDPLGEDYVGYTDTIKRNPAFGWRSLRLARALEPGFVVTIEPGLYFIPELIDRWKAEHKHEQFIDYARLEAYREFGGVRIEDDVLVTDSGARVLSDAIPRTTEDVEAACSR